MIVSLYHNISFYTTYFLAKQDPKSLTKKLQPVQLIANLSIYDGWTHAGGCLRSQSDRLTLKCPAIISTRLFCAMLTAHWGKSQPQLSGASIWGRFFESLKHAKQDLSIIEFENQV